jgi:translation initiation factor IF-1
MPRVEGIVVAQAPGGLYVVEIEGPRRVTAHPSASMDRNFLRLVVGDRVAVELMPQDATRGRVVRKL